MNIKKISLSIILNLLVILSFSLTPVLAVGVAVKPKAIDLKVEVGQGKAVDILVANADDISAIYKIYAEGLSEIVTLEPSEFILEAAGTQVVKLTVKTKKPGIINTELYVVARPHGAGGLPTSSGIKIPLQIVSEGIYFWHRMLVLAIFLGVCLGIFFVIKFRGEKDIFNIHKTNLKQ